MASKVLKDKVKVTSTSKSTLNDRQKQFCIEYIVDLNGLQAYKRAYGEDNSDNTCKSNACQLLTNTNIKQYINELVKEYSENIDVTVGEIVANIKTIAFDKDAKRSDRIKASELLAKYMGMLVEKKDITINDNNIVVSLNDE